MYIWRSRRGVLSTLNNCAAVALSLSLPITLSLSLSLSLSFSVCVQNFDINSFGQFYKRLSGLTCSSGIHIFHWPTCHYCVCQLTGRIKPQVDPSTWRLGLDLPTAISTATTTTTSTATGAVVKLTSQFIDHCWIWSTGCFQINIVKVISKLLCLLKKK